MADITTLSKLRGLVLSASEIKNLTDWPDALIEDYLNILDNLITISNLLDVEISQKIEDTGTNFSDGSIPFADSGFLTEDNTQLFWNTTNSILEIAGRIQSRGRLKGVTRIDTTPYDILITDEIIFVDTDSGSVTINLPAGTQGQTYKIINSGNSGNNVTIAPNGSDLLIGDVAGEYLIDAETLILTFDEIEGWF